MNKIILLAFTVIVLLPILSGCAITSPITPYSESTSKFKEPTKLESNNYPAMDIYWIYHRASSGFTSVQSIRDAAYKRADEFANQKGKSYIVLGEQISNPPYIAGNFQRIEIVFAVIDKLAPTNNKNNMTNQIVIKSNSLQQNPPPTKSKIDRLRELQQMLDEKLITQEEYAIEKKKILNEKE